MLGQVFGLFLDAHLVYEFVNQEVRSVDQMLKVMELTKKLNLHGLVREALVVNSMQNTIPSAWGGEAGTHPLLRISKPEKWSNGHPDDFSQKFGQLFGWNCRDILKR